MKNYKIKNIIAAMVALVAFSACYEDKGNYDYQDVPVITVENLPERITAIQKIDTIVINPTIKSSIEGEIKENNPNFEFECCLLTDGGFLANGERTKDINPDHKKSFKYLPTENTGTYNIWYKVKDKRTGVTSNFVSKLTVSTATSKGWLVLSNEGDENKVRLDLFSDLGNGREGLVKDVMGSEAPVLHNANHVSMYYFAQYCDIIVSSEDGSYYLDNENLTTSEKKNATTQFIADPEGEIINNAITFGYYSFTYMMTNKGNVYAKAYGVAGAMFETPCNTNTMYGAPDYKVAPFIGATPGEMYSGYSAIFYDETNNRFLGRYCANSAYLLSVIGEAGQPNPDDRGTKIVHMSGTRFNNGRAYTVLENTTTGQRYVYAHSLMTNNFSAMTLDLEQKMTADGFNSAKCYAFHSKYPYCFYDNGSDIKICNYMTNTVDGSISIPANEEVTMIKENLLLAKMYSVTNPDIADYEYCIMVGSYDKADPVNGGVLRIYAFDNDSKSLVLKKEMKGFAKIRDVVYRERP